MWWGLNPCHGPHRYLHPWKVLKHWYPCIHVLPWLSKEDEIRYLEELKKYLSDVVLKEIDRRLHELKESS
ncbi:MAG: hypothetical protein QXN90_07895 [Zestosphaera sp.]